MLPRPSYLVMVISIVRIFFFSNFGAHVARMFCLIRKRKFLLRKEILFNLEEVPTHLNQHC